MPNVIVVWRITVVKATSPLTGVRQSNKVYKPIYKKFVEVQVLIHVELNL